MDDQGQQRVLSFWFGDLDDDGLVGDDHKKRWWQKSAAFDEEIRTEFLADQEAIVALEREHWLDTPNGTLAYVVVLDQFSRNMFRDTPRMYAADGRALKVAQAGIESGADRALVTDQRIFLYMPFMHSEELAMQDRCVELFASLRDELSGPAHKRASDNHGYAVQHRDIVAQFGRFPHRNTIVGRESTAEELAFLSQPGSSF